MRRPVTLHHPLAAGSYILLDDQVIDGLYAFRQTRLSDAEAGGILLGMRRGEHLHVTAFTSPGPQDKRARTGFHRTRRHHQAQALEHWTDSAGQVDYLGEWHTHPERSPTPSVTDRREWSILTQRYASPLVFAIAGTSESIWFGVGLSNTLLPAQLVDQVQHPR